MLIVGTVGAFATIYSAFVLEDSVSALGDLYIDGDEKLRVIEELETSLAYYRALSLRHIASEESYTMSEFNIELDYTQEKIQHNLALISGTLDDDSSSVDISQALFNSINEYLQATNQVVHLSADFEKESAFAYMTQVEDHSIPQINTALQQLKRQEFENFSSLRETLTSVAGRNLIVTIAIAIGGGSLALLIAFIVIRRITWRLSHLLNWSREVARGNLAASLSSDSNDEVGRLTLSMKEMANDIGLAHRELADAKKSAENVADELKIYANAFESSGEAMLITDRQNRIININAAFTQQTGFRLQDVVGQDPKILSSGQTSDSTYEEMWQALQEQSFWQGELWDRKKSGQIYPKWIAISAVRDGQGDVLFYIASFSDISERKETEARIEHLAHHDILTGLHNRFNLETRLEQAIVSAHRDQQQLAVLFIDLDRFKHINDSLGHHIGDQLLINVAERLKDCVRESDIVARIGGDEFVIALVGIHDNSQAAVIAEKIIKHIAHPYEIDGHELTTSPSIGISVYPNDGDCVDELLRTADVAMYHAKEHGRNTYHYFTESMYVAANQRLQIERELRVAMHSEQLSLHYQPIISSADLRVVALEALIRWSHPEKGMIAPDLFIPIAEDAGIIQELGNWVIDQASRQLVALKSEGFTNYRIAINLSAKQLQSEMLANDIKSLIDSHSIAGHEIEFELTETAAMNEPEKAVQQLDALRELGIRLAIDDFGTGYSSLAYLKRLPITTLKLDRSFVRDIEVDPNDAAICIATIALAHNLGLKIVAEGVETQAQRDFLMQHGCDFLQGYYFGKPMPAEEITRFLRSYSFSPSSPASSKASLKMAEN